MEITPPGFLKQQFLDDNSEYEEIRPTDELTTIGEFQDIDKSVDEVWLLQCPKGTNIGALEGQKLKFPGRSHLNDLEAVAVEFPSPSNQSFGYYNHKGKCALRLLPVKGSVLLRHRLKANELANADQIESICPVIERVPVPQGIKVRHPLLGVRYEDKLLLESSIAERLRKADETSAKVLRETRNRINKQAQVRNTVTLEGMSNTCGDNSEMKKILKAKRKNCDKESGVLTNSSKKIKKNPEEEEVSEDLKWLKAL